MANRQIYLCRQEPKQELPNQQQPKATKDKSIFSFVGKLRGLLYVVNAVYCNGATTQVPVIIHKN